MTGTRGLAVVLLVFALPSALAPSFGGAAMRVRTDEYDLVGRRVSAPPSRQAQTVTPVLGASPACRDASTLVTESVPPTTQHVRRRAAVRFIRSLNAAQARSQATVGRYAPLVESADLGALPVGFVPRLTLDAWSYVITVKDLFDPCGVSLISDQDGTVYEARPVLPNEGR